jgi:LysM repeat protein
MKKNTLTIVCAFCASSVFAQTSGRDAFLKQQALAEMQRVTAQIDVLQTNQEDMFSRLRKVEESRSEVDSLKAEIASLRATIADLRREMDAQREGIVKDLSGKIARMQPPPEPRGSSKPSKPAYSGPCYEYTVQSGDSLFLIAKAFGTTVQQIKELNGMKNDRIRVGQKLNVPKE